MITKLVRQASARAVEERLRLGLGSEPIVDIRALVEQKGLLVYSTPIANGSLSGCFALIGDDAWIMVNSASTVGRQRFTIAHEYCHSLVDRDLGFVLCTAEKPAHERFADAFAAAFLMPPESGDTYFASDVASDRRITPERVVEYCYAYGVSYVSAVYRLHNLGLFNASHRDVLLRTQPVRLASGMGYDMSDPRSPFYQSDTASTAGSDAFPRAYRSAAVHAYEEERISEMKLAELLRVDVDDLDLVLDPKEPVEVPVV